jgi:hypothetical protein
MEGCEGAREEGSSVATEQITCGSPYMCRVDSVSNRCTRIWCRAYCRTSMFSTWARRGARRDGGRLLKGWVGGRGCGCVGMTGGQ